MLFALKLVQWLHIFLGAVWIGGFVFTMFALWPVLLRRPASEGRALWLALGKTTTPVLASSSIGVVVLGILRGTWFGPIKSWESLSTPYGSAWLTALVLSIAFIVIGISILRRMEVFVWNGDDLHPKAFQRVRLAAVTGLTAFAIILLAMVWMRFGG